MNIILLYNVAIFLSSLCPLFFDATSSFSLFWYAFPGYDSSNLVSQFNQNFLSDRVLFTSIDFFVFSKFSFLYSNEDLEWYLISFFFHNIRYFLHHLWFVLPIQELCFLLQLLSYASMRSMYFPILPLLLLSFEAVSQIS